jgi:hypothetical protein
MKRALVLMVVLGVAASWLTGCSSPKKESASQAPPPSDVASAHGGMEAGGSPPPPAEAQPPQGAMGGMPPGGVAPPPASDSPTAAAGLAWTLPAGWSIDAPRSMRVATYVIPAAPGDAEGAECAVFYFGAGQGGGVEANLQRWIGQFQPSTGAKRWTRKVDGLPVSLADVAGTYTAHGGSMSQSQGDKPGWRLLGAIAEGPQGAVFFKLAGPAKTVAAASKGFDALVASLKKE